MNTLKTPKSPSSPARPAASAQRSRNVWPRTASRSRSTTHPVRPKPMRSSRNSRQGAKAVAVKADVSNADEVRAMFEVTEQQLGKVEVLVNNAGVLKTVPLADTCDALYDQTFDINVRGTFNTLREAATRMNEGGRIVNFSSTTLALNMPATRSTTRRRRPSKRSRMYSPRNCAGATSPSTRWRRVRSRPRCSSTARPKNRSRPSRRCRRCNASASRTISRRWCRSSPVRMRVGSTVRSCARTAASPELDFPISPSRTACRIGRCAAALRK